MSVEVEEHPLIGPETESETEEPKYAHIIDRGEDPRPATSIVIEAMVNGTPVTALCGHTWVPSRDPQKFPICSKCEEIFEFALDFRL